MPRKGRVRQISFELFGAAFCEGCLLSGPPWLGVISRERILLDVLWFCWPCRWGLKVLGGHVHRQRCTAWPRGSPGTTSWSPLICLWMGPLLPCSLLLAWGLAWGPEWAPLEKPGAGETREAWAGSRLSCSLCLSGNCTGCSATFSVLKKRVSLLDGVFAGTWDERQGSSGESLGHTGPGVRGWLR